MYRPFPPSTCLLALFLTSLLLAPLGCEAPEPGPVGEASEGEELAALAAEEDERQPMAQGLLRLLESGSSKAQQRAALAMGRIQSPAYAEALAAASAGEKPAELRRAALFALGQLGLAEGVSIPEEAVTAVNGSIFDEDPSIASAAAQALGKLAPPESAGPLIVLLQHDSPEVREQAAFALFRLRFAPVWRKEAAEPPPLPAAAVQATAVALRDPDPRVRRAAAHTFSRYGESEVREALEGALEDPDELVRIFAARGLAKAGEPAAATALESHLDDPSDQVRGEAVRALTTLEKVQGIPVSLAQDADFHVRAAAARAWGARDGKASEEALEGLLEDPSPTVRAAALEALARRRGDAFVPRLEEALATGPWTLRVAAARAAGHAGSAARRLLDQALADEDSRVQAAAIESLDELSSEEAVTETIAGALASEDLAVRGTAVTTLANRRHPRKIEWLEETRAASPGVEWIEIREGLVDAVGEEDGDGSEELLQQLASDPAPSVARRARAKLEARGFVYTPPPAVAKAPPAATPFLGKTFPQPPVVVLETEKGKLEILTLAREAPIHVANFVQLVRQGFYDGLIWHRVVPNFVIQGGDPLGNGWGGPGYAVRDEIHPRPFRRGSVGMPKAGKDTGGCQIFITHIPTPHLDGNYTIFGEVTSGLEVIDRIEVGDRIVKAYVRE